MVKNKILTKFFALDLGIYIAGLFIRGVGSDPAVRENRAHPRHQSRRERCHL
jgi:hypothetical protein